jgi:putative lipoic acid-binding regulatory protein
MEDQISKLLLDHVYTYKQAPYTFTDSWANAQQADKNSTARIFADGSFNVWFTYFLARRAADKQGHFAGKADHCRIIDSLEGKSVEFKISVVGQVGARIGPEVIEIIKQLCGKNHPENGTNKRHRECSHPSVRIRLMCSRADRQQRLPNNLLHEHAQPNIDPKQSAL